MKPRVALLAFVGAMLIVHAYLAYIFPLQSEDWSHWLWHATNAKKPMGEYLYAFFATHFTMADVAGFALARWKIVHAIVTPIASVALVFGIFVAAMRRLPKASWTDTLAIVLTSAAIWVAQARTGLSYFHSPYVATHLYSATIAIWFVAAFLCKWRIRPWQQPLMVASGLLIGAGSRQLAITTLVATIVFVVRTPRADRRVWMFLSIVTLVIGTVLGVMDTPQLALKGLVNRGFGGNFELANIPIRECGQLLSLFLLVALGKVVLDILRPSWSTPAELPDMRVTIVWFGVWIWLCAASLLGPRITTGAALPATIAICVGTLPFMPWLSSTRWIRLTVVAIAIGMNIVSWTAAFGRVVPRHDEFVERMRIIETTPKGGIAKIPPYDVIYEDYWFFGEDWQSPTLRQSLAINVFGLTDIEFSPSFGRNEKNPRVPIRFESSLTAQEIEAADPPKIWATEVVAARQQFDLLMKTLRQQGKTNFTARLVVDLDFPGLAGRPLLAAWVEGKTTMSPRVTRTPPDDASIYWVRLPPKVARQLPESFAIYPDGVRPIAFETNGYPMQPISNQRHAVVACNTARCLVVDAFSPWL